MNLDIITSDFKLVWPSSVFFKFFWSPGKASRIIKVEYMKTGESVDIEEDIINTSWSHGGG